MKHKFFPKLKKIYYFSDGSAAQYKNRKNFSNLCHHVEDFAGIEAEWHFYATSHGKEVCDCIGGTVKRLAAKASLQNPINNQILSAFQLFEWGKANIPSITFFYATNDKHIEEEKSLAKRFSETTAVTGTQKYHGFIPMSKDKIKAKVISDLKKFYVHKIQMCLDTDDLPFEQITGFY